MSDNQKFIRAEMLLGSDSLNKLNNTHVAVFGLGGVGSWCAEALARMGVGEMTLVDTDTVSETNINRQLCALSSTVGQNKADIMANRIKDINPNIILNVMPKLYNAESREEFFLLGFTCVVDAIDLVSCKLDLIETCINRNIAIVSSLGTGNKLDGSRFVITDISKTRNCPFARVMRKELRNRGIEQLTVVFSDEEASKPTESETPPPGRRSVPGSLVYVTGAAGFLLAQAAVEKIINE